MRCAVTRADGPPCGACGGRPGRRRGAGAHHGTRRHRHGRPLPADITLERRLCEDASSSERAPRDAFATLVEPEESGGRRRGVIPRGRLKVRCDGSVGSVWVFVALSRVTRASEPAVGAHGAEAHAPTKMRISSFRFSVSVLAGLSAITKCAYRYRYQNPNRNQIYHHL